MLKRLLDERLPFLQQQSAALQNKNGDVSESTSPCVPLPSLVLGVMSGTSLDGVDLALMEVSGSTSLHNLKIHRIIAFETVPFPVELDTSLRRLLSSSSTPISNKHDDEKGKRKSKSAENKSLKENNTMMKGKQKEEEEDTGDCPQSTGVAATTRESVLKEICLLNTQWSRCVGAMINAFLENNKFVLQRKKDGSVLLDDEMVNVNNSSSRPVLIGCHGQTIWHEGSEGTFQIGDGEVLAQVTQCAVVSNFRASDVGQGGTGAPLVPFFDRYLAEEYLRNKVKKPGNEEEKTSNEEGRGKKQETSVGGVAFQNLGGIGNVSYYYGNAKEKQEEGGKCVAGRRSEEIEKGNASSSSSLIAFDTGPANVLLNEFITSVCERYVASLTPSSQEEKKNVESASDEAASENCNHSFPFFDQDGCYSQKGQADERLLQSWLQHFSSYLHAAPPKSTGRELFSPNFVREEILVMEDDAKKLIRMKNDEEEEGNLLFAPFSQRFFDICATLVEFTAVCIFDSYQRFLPQLPEVLFVSGGGARNTTLLSRLTCMFQPLGCHVILLSEAFQFPSSSFIEGPLRSDHDYSVRGKCNNKQQRQQKDFNDDHCYFDDAKEAIAFGVFAHEKLNQLTGVELGLGCWANEPSVTGSRKRICMGQLSFPA